MVMDEFRYEIGDELDHAGWVWSVINSSMEEIDWGSSSSYESAVEDVQREYPGIKELGE